MGTSMPNRGAWCTYRAIKALREAWRRQLGSSGATSTTATSTTATLIFDNLCDIYLLCTQKPAKYLNKHCWVCYPVVLLSFLWCGDDEKAPTGHLLTAAACRVAMVSYFHFHFFVIRIGSEGWGNRALQVNPSCSRLSSQSPGISTSFCPFIWGYR